MFDDTDNKTSDNSSEGGDNTSPAVPPSVSTDKEKSSEASVQPVPVGDLPAPAAPKSPSAFTESKPSAGVEDIFSNTDAGEDEPIKPAAFQPKAGPTSTEEPSVEESSGNKLRKIIIPFVLIVTLGAIGVGGVYGYKYVINLIGAEDAKVINNSGEENKQNDVTGPVDTEIIEPEPDNITSPIKPAEPISTPPSSPASATPPQDTDGDGLSDQEEITLGTNINSVDTDNDGLFDREEVYVYKTDPINEDTDGDGFLDGAEVQDGYNPNGSGKLYEIN